MTDHIASLLEALKGTQNSESLSREVRNMIYVERSISGSNSTLEKILVDELSAGRSLIIAGSAGGGKTMLIDYLQDRLESLGRRIPEKQVIPDLTAIAPPRVDHLNKVVTSGQYLVAANEGILRDKEIIDCLPNVWETVKKLQLGVDFKNLEMPIVIDIAGFDPIESSLRGILVNKNIREAIYLHEKKCELNSELIPCSRIESLNLLDEKMSDLIASLVVDAIGPGEVTYRDLWNFIRDIFLGGNCADSILESVWFWRLFYGPSQISRKLFDYHKPNFLSLPEWSPYLYRGDWEKVSNELINSSYSFIFPGQPPHQIEDTSARDQVQTWLKIQIALIFRASGFDRPIFLGETSGELENKILKLNKLEILPQLINGYFRREKFKDQSSSLELWLDFSTERKSKRSLNLVRIGEFPKRDLRLKRSSVVANISDLRIEGTRVYLTTVDENSGLLELSAGFFDAIVQGRPISTARRKYDDVDNALRKFFLEIYDPSKVEDSSIIALLTPGTSDALVEVVWKIGIDLEIERVRG